MKSKHYNYKVTPILFSLILLVQSCAVYDAVPVTAQEAIDSYQNIKSRNYWKVKINSDNVEYKFKYLAEKDGKIYGIVRKNSKTAKLLSNQIKDTAQMIHKKSGYNNSIQIPLTNEQSNEVHLIDRGKTIRNGVLIGIPVTLVAIFGMAYLFGEAFGSALVESF